MRREKEEGETRHKRPQEGGGKKASMFNFCLKRSCDVKNQRDKGEKGRARRENAGRKIDFHNRRRRPWKFLGLRGNVRNPVETKANHPLPFLESYGRRDQEKEGGKAQWLRGEKRRFISFKTVNLTPKGEPISQKKEINKNLEKIGKTIGRSPRKLKASRRRKGKKGLTRRRQKKHGRENANSLLTFFRAGSKKNEVQ